MSLFYLPASADGVLMSDLLFHSRDVLKPNSNKTFFCIVNRWNSLQVGLLQQVRTS